MNKIRTLISILLLCFIFNNSWSQECSGDLNGFTTLGEYQNSKYYLSDHNKNWQGASAEAATLGGYLVSIGSQEENTFIKNNIGSIIPIIGYSDHLSEGDFLWDSGETVTYTNLTASNNEGKDYAVMNFWNGSWALVTQSVYKPFVIEIPCDGGGQNDPCQFDITDVVFPAVIQPGQTATLEATVTNIGDQASVTDFVNLYQKINRPVGPPLFDEIQVGAAIPPLAIGASVEVQFSVTIPMPHYVGQLAPTIDGANTYGEYTLVQASGNPLICQTDLDFEVDFINGDLELSVINNSDCYGIDRVVQADLQVTNVGNSTMIAPIFVELGSAGVANINANGEIIFNQAGNAYWVISNLLEPGESETIEKPFKVNSTTTLPIELNPVIDSDISNVEEANTANNSVSFTASFDDFCTTDLPSRIATHVFWDENSNGVRNLPEDEGISNHPVQVEDQNNNIVAGGSTDSEGRIEFVGLAPGTYRLVYDFIFDAGVSPKNAPSGTPYTDSDINSDAKTDFFTIGDGQLVDDLAAGFVPGFMPEGSIAVRTWFDQDGDGIQDIEDYSISGVVVRLEDSNGSTIYNAMSNSNGEIIFDDLLAGQYRVITETPTGRMPTLKNAPNSTADDDSDINADGTTDLITLGPGEIITNIGAGYRTTNNETDVELSVSVNNEDPNLYQKVTMTYTLANTSQNVATDLSVKIGVCSIEPNSNINNIGFFNQANGLVNTSPNPTTSLGTYNKTTQFWMIPQLAAGTSATLEVTVFVLSTEERVLVGEVILGGTFDTDSAYGNMNNCAVQEDDEASFALNGDNPPIGNEPCQLSISNIVFPAVVQPGETVTLSATVTNDGNQASVATQLSLYQQIVVLGGGFNDLPLIEEGVLVPALASGTSTNIQFQVNLPAPLYVDFFNPEDRLFSNYGKYLLMIADDAENIFNPNTCFTEFDFEVDFINTDLSVEFVNNGGCYGNNIFDTDLQVTNHGNVATTAPIYVKLDAAFPFIFVNPSLPYIYHDPASVDAYWKITETLQPGESFRIESPFTVFDEYQSDIEIVMTILTEQSNVDDAVTANNTAIANFVQDENCGGGGTNAPCQLSISNVNFPAVVQPSETVTVTATITNDGNFSSASTNVNLYQFRGTTHGPPPIDFVQNGAAVPTLLAGASTTVQFEVDLPDPLYTSGIFPSDNTFTWGDYILAIEEDAASGSLSYLNCNTALDFEVDFPDIDLELSWINNDGCYGSDYVVAADLQVTNLSNQSTTAPIVVHLGNSAFVDLSVDGIVLNTVDFGAHWDIYETLAPGESVILPRPFTVPGPGTYDFRPNLDAGISNIDDPNLLNNSLDTEFNFNPTCGDENPFVDLVATLDPLPNNLQAGDVITLNGSIENIGTEDALGTVYRFSFSEDEISGIGDIVLNNLTIPSIAAGGTYPLSIEVTLPNVNAGNYYIILAADANDTIIESNEDNNIDLEQINFQNNMLLPDLEIIAAQVPAQISGSSNIEIILTFANAGNAAFNGNIPLDVCISSLPDNFCDIPVGLLNANVSIPVNGMVDYTFTFLFPAIPDSYIGNGFLNFIIDRFEEISETDEFNNNFNQATVFVEGNTGDDIDLELAISTPNPNPNIYSHVPLTYTITNTSNTTATNVKVEARVCNPVSSIPSVFRNGVQIVNSSSSPPSTSVGTYNTLDQVWTIPTLGAGVSATLDLRVFTLTAEERVILGEVIAADQLDIDSDPDNRDACNSVEDDEAEVVLNAEDPPTGNEPCQLQISNVVFPAIIQPGQTVMIQAEVTNSGSQMSVADQINLYQYTVTAHGPQPVRLIQNGTTVPALAAGASTSIQFSVVIPMPHYVGQPVPFISGNGMFGSYSLIIETDADAGSYNFPDCDARFNFEVDFEAADLAIEIINNEGCFGADRIVQTDLQVTNVGNTTLQYPVYVDLGHYIHVDLDHPNILYNGLTGSVFWEITTLLAPGQSAIIDNPYKVVNEFFTEVDITAHIDNDISNIDDSNNADNSVATTVVLNENCGSTMTCDYQNAQWLNDILADNAALCAGIELEINAYEYNGDIFIGIISDHIAYNTPLHSIYNCDGTVFCLSEFVVGVPNCGSDWFNNAVLIEQLWSREDDCEPTPKPDFNLSGFRLRENVFPTGLEVIEPNSTVIPNNTIELSALNMSGVVPGPELVFEAVTKFYLSADEVIDAGDLVLFVYDDHNLNFPAPTNNYFSEGATGSFVIPETVDPGFYNIIAKFDADDEIMEANEDNNVVILPIIINFCICPQVIDPVCGSDGVTYGNACEAECAGIFDYTPGECTNGVVDLTPISLQFDSPVEVPIGSPFPLEITVRIDNIGTLDFSGTITTQFCLSRDTDSCEREINITSSPFLNIPAGGSQNVIFNTSVPYLLTGEYFWTVTLDIFDAIPESNLNNRISAPITIIGDCDCGSISYYPVCGSDGMTYDNSCAAICAGVFDYTPGECSSCEDNCPDNFAPVCGSDGVTYENECIAECNGVFDYSSGECPVGNDGVDLELDIIAPATYNIYNNVTFQYRVFNNGTVNAENVIVDVPLPDGFVHSSNSTSNGEFDLFREKWEAGTIKVGETAVLDLNLFALTSGAVTAYAQVASANPDDVDSTPGNGTCCTPNEDDEAAITIGTNLQGGNGTSAFSAPNANRDLDIKTIYPNVATDEITIFVQSKLPELNLRVYNLQGHEVLQQKYQDTEGFQRLHLDVAQLPTGTYLLRFDGTLGQQTLRFLKVKM